MSGHSVETYGHAVVTAFGGIKTARDAHRGRIEDFRWTEIKNNMVRTHTLVRYPVQYTSAHLHIHRRQRPQRAGRRAGRRSVTATQQQEILATP